MMNSAAASGSPQAARSARVVWVFLGLLGLAQAGAFAYSLRIPEATEKVVAAATGAGPAEKPAAAPTSAAPAAAADEDPFRDPAAVVADPHPELLGQPVTAPAVEDPAEAMLRDRAAAEAPRVPVVSTGPRPRPATEAAPLDVPITDEAVLEQLESGLHLRSVGDTSGALNHLRLAAEKLPQHPKILYHLALTYDTMGLQRKAQPVWEALRALGDGAGDFFVLARDRLRDGVPFAAEPEEEREGRFTVADLREEKVPDAVGGERVRFTVDLRRRMEGPVDPDRMTLAIHFFDSVNGRRIARSFADQAVLTCLTEPADWKDGVETYQFDYWLPAMSPEELVKYGRCRYYGCTLEVIYEGKLQDATATTPELLQIARELPLPEAVTGDSILDSGPVPEVPPSSALPENLLFPPAPPAGTTR